jgi:tRNA (guanine9-N1)-methyltransferase
MESSKEITGELQNLENLNLDNQEEENNSLTSCEFNFEQDFFTEKPIDEEKLARMDQTKENKQKFIEIKKKEMRKITRDKRKENKKKKLESLTQEERWRNWNIRQEEFKKQEENLKLGMQSEYRIIFDLDYLNLMKTREIKSLASQVANCYSLNKKINTPFQYLITNYTGEAKYELENMGSKNWHVKYYEEKFSEVEEIINLAKTKEIIYLSPDSPNLLDDVKTDYIFVIGGFVDKPVSKYRSLDKATNLKIKTARLPLEEYLPDIMNPVLNINNVVEILAKYMETKSWEATIKELIPLRMLNKK